MFFTSQFSIDSRLQQKHEKLSSGSSEKLNRRLKIFSRYSISLCTLLQGVSRFYEILFKFHFEEDTKAKQLKGISMLKYPASNVNGDEK